MKKVQHYISTTAIALILLVSSSANAQKDSKETYTPFLIEIDVMDNDVALKCTTGCAWKTLSFTTVNESTQWIDASGMVEKSTAITIDKSLAPFKISMQKVGDRLLLKSINGTPFKDISLNATLRYTMQINEFGFIQ